MHVLDNWKLMKDGIYNVGLSDANISKRELCERIKVHIPEFTILEAPVGSDPDKRDYIVSNQRLREAGFATAWSLDRGIQELIKGYTILRNARYSNV